MPYDPISAAAERNRAVQNARAANVPEVGIWWLIDGQLIADSIPYTAVPDEAGFRAGRKDHFVAAATSD